MNKPFYISLHDVLLHHPHEEQVCIEKLHDKVGSRFMTAVVPNGINANHTSLIKHIGDSQSFIIQHGFNHTRKQNLSPFSWLINQSDEFNGYNLEETKEKVSTGKKILEDAFQVHISCFAPPGWALKKAQAQAIYGLGFDSLHSMFHIHHRCKAAIKTKLIAWDYGKYHTCTLLGKLFSNTHAVIHRNSVPHLVLHPLDVKRNHLNTAMQTIDQLIDLGYTPSFPFQN